MDHSVPQGTHYQVLGIDESASAAEVTAAFRHMAMRWHPDRNKHPEATVVFVRIRRAFEVLSSAVERRAYDAQLRPSSPFDSWPGYRGPNAFYGGREPSMDRQESRDPFDFDEHFRELNRGEHVFDDLYISYAQAIEGARVRIKVKAPQVCRRCDGSGSDAEEECFLLRQSRTYGGRHGPGCFECGGSGKVQYQCRTCRGTGTTRRLRHAEVNVPPGVEQGELIRLAGLGGDSVRNGDRGDIFLKIHFLEDDDFRHEGLDLVRSLVLNPFEAMFGCKLRIPTPRGVLNLAIPRVKGERRIKFAGQGLFSARRKIHGDLYLEPHVEPIDPAFPFTPEEESVLRKLSERYRRFSQ